MPLTEDEAGYVEAARANNTLRGYRSDWHEFAAWASQRGDTGALPAAPSQISSYLSELAQAGAKVGTLSPRLSAIRFVHQLHDHPDPTRNAQVIAVWEGIRRHPRRTTGAGQPADATQPVRRARPLPDHQDRAYQSSSRRTDLAAARDRAMLLVGFVAALRRSELAAIRVDDLDDHPNGLVLSLPRSKTN